MGARHQDGDRRRSRCRRGSPIQSYGHFANERQAERARDRRRIAAWADAGAPAGNDDDGAAADRVRERLEHQARHHRRDAEAVRAAGRAAPSTTSTSSSRPTSRRTCGWSRPRCGPGNPTVLHHGKVWVRPPGSTWMEKARARRGVRDARRSATSSASNAIEEGNDILGKFNPGLGAQRFDMEGAAKFVPKGSDLVSSCTTRRRASRPSDVSKLGLVLAKEPPQKRYYFHAGPTALQPRDPAGRRQRRSRERDHVRRGRDGSSTRSRTCTCAARISSCASSRPTGKAGRCSRATSTSSGRWAISTPSRSSLPKGTKLQLITPLRQLAGEPLQPRSDEEESSGVRRTGTR